MYGFLFKFSFVWPMKSSEVAAFCMESVAVVVVAVEEAADDVLLRHCRVCLSEVVHDDVDPLYYYFSLHYRHHHVCLVHSRCYCYLLLSTSSTLSSLDLSIISSQQTEK